MNFNLRKIVNPYHTAMIIGSAAVFFLTPFTSAEENSGRTSFKQNQVRTITSTMTLKNMEADQQFWAMREEQEEEYETCCRDGERHQGMGRQGEGGHHMGRGKGHHGGPGMGGMGRGMHRRGRQGMHHGDDGTTAQCPQPRSTGPAPQQFINQSIPLEATPENIENGRLLFQLDSQPTCTACHGTKGDGLGMMGGALTPPPRNFTCRETMQSIADGQLFWIIKNGSSGTGMPAFSNLSDEQVWKLILHIRSLTQAQ